MMKDPIHILCEDLLLFATVSLDEFLNFFNISFHFAGAWSPVCLLPSTNTQLALKCACHSETDVRFKECSLEA